MNVKIFYDIDICTAHPIPIYVFYIEVEYPIYFAGGLDCREIGMLGDWDAERFECNYDPIGRKCLYGSYFVVE